MLETSARLLRLLTLLQARRDWATTDLADRLGVAPRTVRRDVERLRSLGYPVHSTPGVAGGYRLGAGTALPPLLLDDEEAVAVAVGLRTAATGTVAGIEETSVRALAKLEQVLPSHLRHRLNTLQTAMVPTTGTGPKVDPGTLTAIAAACRDHQQLRLDYQDHDGGASIRTVEPHRLVATGRRWYLVAWDVDRADWRTFRVDRLHPHLPAGPRFTARDDPDGDVAAFVARRVAATLWRYRARITVYASAATVAEQLPPTWLVEAVDDHTCVLDAGADTPYLLAVYLSALDLDFDARDIPELAEHLLRLADRCQRAARP